MVEVNKIMSFSPKKTIKRLLLQYPQEEFAVSEKTFCAFVLLQYDIFSNDWKVYPFSVAEYVKILIRRRIEWTFL